MQKTLLLNLLLLCSLTTAMAQIEIEDGFESYTDGFIGPQSSLWTTWTGAVGGLEEGIVTNTIASTGEKSLMIFGDPSFPNGGPTDCILKLGNHTSGRYELSWDMLVDDADGGYFNIQHLETPGAEFAFEVRIDGGGLIDGLTQAELNYGGEDYVFLYQRGEWVRVKLLIDMDLDDIELWLDDMMVLSWTFSVQSNSPTGTNQLSGLNFFPRDWADKFFVDNIKYEKLMPNNTSETLFAEVDIFPTLIEEELQIELPEALKNQNLQMVLLNQFGQIVQTFDVKKTSHSLGGMASGMYYIRMEMEGNVYSQKVVRL